MTGTRRTNEYRCRWSTDEIAARDTAQQPFQFGRRIHDQPGDPVVVLSKQGDSFLGHIVGFDTAGYALVELR